MVVSMLSRVLVSALVALALVGCASSDYGTKQTVGALAGAGAGGLLGAQVGKGSTRLAATAAGTLLGAFLGSEVGRSLDRADAVHASQAQYQALEYTPSGYATSWRNPDTGHYGSVTRSRLTRARVARTAASSSTRPRSAAAAATSTAPRAALRMASGR
jgi:surface antigen